MSPFVDLRKAARSLGQHRFPLHRVRADYRSRVRPRAERMPTCRHVVGLHPLAITSSQDDHQSTCRQIDTVMQRTDHGFRQPISYSKARTDEGRGLFSLGKPVRGAKTSCFQVGTRCRTSRRR